jgi:hypothetical protein
MAQNIIAPAAWSLAILRKNPSMVIEIGTSKGGFSSLLSACVEKVGGEFHTMDVHSDGDYNQYPLYGNSKFHLLDCFSEEGLILIADLVAKPGLCFLLCDGGNKVREFDLFSRIIKPDDVIAAHDYFDETVPDFHPTYWGWCETELKKIQPAIDRYKLVDFMPEWFQFSAWKTCVKIK